MAETQESTVKDLKAARKAKRQADKKAERQARKARREERRLQNFKLRGFHTVTELRRSLPMIVRQAEEKKKEVSIGTTRKTPQMRLRAIELCDPAEVEAVPESDRVSAQRFLDGFSQYRALILVLNGKLLVRSGESRAIIDRHPDSGHDIVDAYLASRAMTPAAAQPAAPAKAAAKPRDAA